MPYQKKSAARSSLRYSSKGLLNVITTPSLTSLELSLPWMILIFAEICSSNLVRLKCANFLRIYAESSKVLVKSKRGLFKKLSAVSNSDVSKQL